MPKNLKNIYKLFNVDVHTEELYELAFTHSSCNSSLNGKHLDYERLEFIGDSVVGLITVDIAAKLHPLLDQGMLTKLKSNIVNTKSLSNYALKFKFNEYIKVGHSFKNDLKHSNAILEDVFEAFVGALYLDQGFNKTYEIVHSIIYDDIKNFKFTDHIDYKSKLQEEIQAESRKTLTYRVAEENGPAHNRSFVIEVIFDDMVLGVGEGHSKKEAEQNAAKSALSKRAVK